MALEDALRRLEEQHHDELAQLEVRLQAFYQAEWDKVHLTYQQEADKCRTLMEQQVGLSHHSAAYHLSLGGEWDGSQNNMRAHST